MSPMTMSNGGQGGAVRHYWKWAGSACLVLLLTIYVNTGSLVPMALTGGCMVTPETGYVHNSDVPLHLDMTEWMVGRLPASTVDMMVGRRALWHVLMIPLHLTLSWETAAFVLNLFLLLGAALVFARWGRRVFGDPVTLWILWLLSTFPATGYFGSLAMHYGIIIPAGLFILLIFGALEPTTGFRRLLWLNLALGFLGFAYDFVPFTAPAMALLLIAWKRWRWILPALLLQILPVLIWVLVLRSLNADALDNGNTRVYINPVIAWVQHFEIAALGKSLREAPALIWGTYLHSGYTYLPLLGIGLSGWALVKRKAYVALKDYLFILVGAAIMLFICLTPVIPQGEQTGWMFQGGLLLSCARLFVLVAISLLVICARVLGEADPRPRWLQRAFQASAVVCIGLNAVVSLGMIVPAFLPYAKLRHVQFYALHHAGWIEPRLEYLGRRPFGFTRTITTLEPIRERDPVAFRYMMLKEALGSRRKPPEQ